MLTLEKWVEQEKFEAISAADVAIAQARRWVKRADKVAAGRATKATIAAYEVWKQSQPQEADDTAPRN